MQFLSSAENIFYEPFNKSLIINGEMW